MSGVAINVRTVVINVRPMKFNAPFKKLCTRSVVMTSRTGVHIATGVEHLFIAGKLCTHGLALICSAVDMYVRGAKVCTRGVETNAQAGAAISTTIAVHLHGVTSGG